MVADKLLTASTATLDAVSSSDFSPKRWLDYFEKNRGTTASIRITNDTAITDELRIPLLKSLAKFQIGETGEGKHLRKFAKRMNSADYETCIDLFIKEEQTHARILAEIIGSLDGTLLQSHWSDICFIALRRMLGLKTEIFILLIAEIIGKCFYLLCARKLESPMLSNAFALIVLDEIAHLEFHCEFLQWQLGQLSQSARLLIYFGWSMLFCAASFVFVLDHGKTLSGLGISSKEFLVECSKTFQRAAFRSLSI